MSREVLVRIRQTGDTHAKGIDQCAIDIEEDRLKGGTIGHWHVKVWQIWGSNRTNCPLVPGNIAEHQSVAMQISALFGLTSQQAGVPLAGVPAGFEALVAQILAAGGPEPPGAPPGEADPCGEKLTTVEPNAQSIQPDSATEPLTQTNPFALVMSNLAVGRLLSASHSASEATQVSPQTLTVEVAHRITMPQNLSSASEQMALRQLMLQPELGIQRIVVDQTEAPVAAPNPEALINTANLVAPTAASEPVVVDKSQTTNLNLESIPNVGAEQAPTETKPSLALDNAPIEPAAKSDVQMSRADAKPATDQPVEAALLTKKPEANQGRSAGLEVEGDDPKLELAFNGASDKGEQSFNSDSNPGSSTGQRNPDARPEHGFAVVHQTARPVEAVDNSIQVDRATPNHQLVRDLADRIEMALAAKPQERVTVEFRPLDLGDIKLILTQQNDQVDARIITDNDRVRQAVAAVQPELRQSLEQRGLQLGSFSVSNFGDAPAQQRQSDQPQFQMPNQAVVTREPSPSARPTHTASVKTTGVDLSI